MNARIPLPDWRDNIRGIPIASLTEQGIKPLPKTIDAIEDELARSAVERISERQQVARPKGRAG